MPYHSVCLNYGKPDPSLRMTYKPVRLEDYTDNQVLQETLRLIGTGRLDSAVAQAAAWHITDNMSWERLASLREYRLPVVYSSQVPTFSWGQLRTARQLVEVAAVQAEDRAQLTPETKTAPVQSRSPGKTR